MADVELESVLVEYQGSPVPYCRPQVESVQAEYIRDPETSNGIIQGGIVDPAVSLTVSASVPLLSKIAAADLLAYSEVSSNANFDDEAKWRYLVVQYLHRVSGQIRNIHHRKNGSFWEGYVTFFGSSAVGYWDRRGILIRAVNEVELILPPTRFLDGETIILKS